MFAFILLWIKNVSMLNTFTFYVFSVCYPLSVTRVYILLASATELSIENFLSQIFGARFMTAVFNVNVVLVLNNCFAHCCLALFFVFVRFSVCIFVCLAFNIYFCMADTIFVCSSLTAFVHYFAPMDSCLWYLLVY